MTAKPDIVHAPAKKDDLFLSCNSSGNAKYLFFFARDSDYIITPLCLCLKVGAHWAQQLYLMLFL